MMATQEKSKGPIPFENKPNWEQLQRDDIYRQRVFGTDSGSDFIDVDDKRKLTPLNLLLYLVFMYLTILYIWKRMSIRNSYEVNEAVEISLLTASYDSDPILKTWVHISSMKDVEAWLLNAFPGVVMPTVQVFNKPIGTIRFTVRRIKQERLKDNNFGNSENNPRGRNLTMWVNKNGISVKKTSDEDDHGAPEGDDDDDHDEGGDHGNYGNYGTWRDWRTSVVRLEWLSKRGMAPDAESAELLDMLELTEKRDTPDEELNNVRHTCKQWCENLIVPKPCHTFTISGAYICQFYHMESLVEFEEWRRLPALLRDISDEVYGSTETLSTRLFPRLEDQVGKTVFWPTMKAFQFSSARRRRDFTARRRRTNDRPQGYWGTPGYVTFLDYTTEGAVEEAADRRDEEDGVYPVQPPTQPRVIERQLRDWISGGWLQPDTAALAVDFVTHNTNYQSVTWAQLQFTFTASGYVEKDMQIDSLPISTAAIDASSEGSWTQDMGSFDVVYALMVVGYIMWELLEIFQRGKRYLTQASNHLCALAIVLHASTIVTWANYLRSSEFTALLSALKNEGTDEIESTETTSAFDRQAIAYRFFLQVSAINMFLCMIQLLHHFNDIFPRVAALMDTMWRAVVPVCYLMVIIASVLMSFTCWGWIMFGKSVSRFTTLSNSISALVTMLFGDVEGYNLIHEHFPMEGMVFYVLYMVLFNFIFVNLAKAVVAMSYEDAMESLKEAQQKDLAERGAQQNDNTGDYLTRVARGMKTKMVAWYKEGQQKVPPEPTEEEVEQLQQWRILTAILYCFYTCCFVGMVYLQASVSVGNLMQVTATQALTSPTFPKNNPTSGDLIPANNWSTIETQEDVLEWLYVALPQTMFNSSNGDFDGDPNPLKLYHAAATSVVPEDFEQLVVNNWNIIVGQKPLRISLRYLKMERLGEDKHIAGLSKKEDLVRIKGANGLPVQMGERGDIPGASSVVADDVSQIEGPGASEVVQFLNEHCEWSVGFGAIDPRHDNAFACMLSVNAEDTMDTLRAMHHKHVVTDQLATLVIDFVMYNAYAEAFIYVAAIFNFQPSGKIDKTIWVETVTLDLFRSWTDYLRTTLTITVFTMDIGYLLALLRDLYRAVANRGDAHYTQTWGKEWLMSVSRAVFLFFSMDLFNIMDLISCILTLVALVLWYVFVFIPFREQYFFAERPDWDAGGACEPSWTWCSDQSVLVHFYIAGFALRAFIQMNAINTIAIFFHILKFFQWKSSTSIMLTALKSSIRDILAFVVVVGVILAGFTCMGHNIFGANVQGFRSIADSIKTCFEMFLGTFDYQDLKQAQANFAPIFFYSYMPIFRFVVINMFLAIIYMNFKMVDDERVDREVEEEENMTRKKRKGILKRYASMAWGMVTGKKSRGTVGLADADDIRASTDEDDDAKRIAEKLGNGNGEPLAVVASDEFGSNKHSVKKRNTAQNADNHGVPNEETLKRWVECLQTNNIAELMADKKWQDFVEDPSDSPVKDKIAELMVAEKNVSNRHWRRLPKNMRDWAIATSRDLYMELIKWVMKRENTSANTEIERCLEDAETTYKEKMKESRKESSAVKQELELTELSKLRAVHEDQESLAWYIMKQEAELTKLKQAKETKKDRIDKMMSAAESLVVHDDDPMSLVFTPQNGQRSGDPLQLRNG